MGGTFSKIFKRSPARNVRVLMLGLDNAGKTTILNRLKDNNKVEVVPTVGYNLKRLTYKNYTINVWDVGGQESIRPLWQHYYRGSDALIFVVDASDPARIAEARAELHQTVNDLALRQTMFLIFANKTDRPGSIPIARLARLLDLHVFSDRQWTLVSSCATSGTGLTDGLNWLVQSLNSALGGPKASSSAPASTAPLTAQEMGSLTSLNAGVLARMSDTLQSGPLNCPSSTPSPESKSTIKSETSEAPSTPTQVASEQQSSIAKRISRRITAADQQAHRISMIAAHSYSVLSAPDLDAPVMESGNLPMNVKMPTILAAQNAIGIALPNSPM